MVFSPSFRAIYRVVDDHGIDADICLPTKHKDAAGHPVGAHSDQALLALVNCRTLLTHANHLLVVIGIHGGVFMLRSSDLIDQDQIQLGNPGRTVAPNTTSGPESTY